MKVLHDTHTAHKLLQVLEDDNGSRYLLLEGRDEIHSEFNPAHVMLQPVKEHYWNFLSSVGILDIQVKSVLIIGMGAGTVARQLLHYRPNLHIEGIEIDKAITLIGKKFFGHPSSVTVHHQDAQKFLENNKDIFDYIILDAFFKGNLVEDFCTKEFIGLVKSHLNPSGILGVNYLGHRPVSSMIKSSMRAHFSEVTRICMPGTYNYIIFGSDRKIRFRQFHAPDEDIKRLNNFIIRHKEQL